MYFFKYLKHMKIYNFKNLQYLFCFQINEVYLITTSCQTAHNIYLTFSPNDQSNKKQKYLKFRNNEKIGNTKSM